MRQSRLLLVEANYGQGRLIISAIDFDQAPTGDVVSAQLRASLLAYTASAGFNSLALRQTR